VPVLPGSPAASAPSTAPAGTEAQPQPLTEPGDRCLTAAQSLVSALVHHLMPIVVMQGVAWVYLSAEQANSSPTPSGHSLCDACRAIIQCWYTRYSDSSSTTTTTTPPKSSTGPVHDSELLSAVAVQVLPFLVRAYALHCACGQNCGCEPDDEGLMRSYTELRPDGEGACDLVDELCAAMGVPGNTSHHLQRAVAAVTLYGADLCMNRWCGHLRWAFSNSSMHRSSSSSSSSSSSRSNRQASAEQCDPSLTWIVLGQQPVHNKEVLTPLLLPAPPHLVSLPLLFQDLLLHFAGKVSTRAYMLLLSLQHGWPDCP